MQQNPSLIHRIMNGSIVLQILIGMLAGIAVASVVPDTAQSLTFLGSLFVKGLKAVAPVLVFVLVASAIASKKQGVQTNMRPVLTLYLLGTFLAAVTGVLASFAFPTTLKLVAAAGSTTPPSGRIPVAAAVAYPPTSPSATSGAVVFT